jgi:hypothetical protein
MEVYDFAHSETRRILCGASGFDPTSCVREMRRLHAWVEEALKAAHFHRARPVFCDIPVAFEFTGAPVYEGEALCV